MKKLITITEEQNLDHIAWEEFSDHEDFERVVKGKFYSVCSIGDYPLVVKKENGFYSLYKYRRPIEEPKVEPVNTLWTHEQLVAFHTKNPHAVWQHNEDRHDHTSMGHSIVYELELYRYSLDLGETWREPKGDVV